MSNYGLIRLKALKDSSCANQLDCVISYFFQLHLMLYVYVERFDVMDIVGKILGTKRGLRKRKGSNQPVLKKEEKHAK